jgi:probable O-glycosylation ligase (exosortase A-associated)
MRDIVLVLIFTALLSMVFKHPVIGAYLWAWFSLMNPHKTTWGFAYSLPFAQIIAVVTLVAVLLSSKRQRLPMNAITVLWLAMVFWMCVTSLFALNTPSAVLDRLVFVMKIHLMLLVTLMLVLDAKQLRTLVVVVTLSVAFFGIKGGLFTLVTGGGYRVSGPPGGMLGGNNEFATAMVALVPFLYWMRQTVDHRWLRHALTLSIVLSIFAILGTQSRGALLAIVAMAVFMGLKSQHPFRMTLLMVGGLAVAIGFMPDSWTQRMDTIGTYQEDTSAMSRLWTWTTLFNAAVDRPLVGAGFRADASAIFLRYAPAGGQWGMFSGLDKVWVAHSIYFQMLGEHGFVGLALYLALWITVWVQAGRLARQAQQLPALASWLPLLMRMTQVSLVGYSVGGAFLSLAYLDLPYYFMAYVILAQTLVQRTQTSESKLGRAQLAVAAGGALPSPQLGSVRKERS